jgi:hypothetical protein
MVRGHSRICLSNLFLLSICPIIAAQVQIDHVTVAGANLDAMRKALTNATGIPSEYGGRHTNRATEMALVSFPDGSYLELMGIQPHADPTAVARHVWSTFLKRNAGPCAFAIRAGNDKQLAQLRSTGIHVEGPDRGGRTRPDGTRLEWETTDLGSGLRGTFFPFMIRDLTPRENRAYLSGKPTTDRAAGIGKIVIGVENLGDALAQYRLAFKLPAPRRQRDTVFDAELAWFDGTPIILAQGLTANSWLTRRVAKFGNIPCAFVLSATGESTGTRTSRWFGQKVSWADEGKLGWWLGMELPIR